MDHTPGALPPDLRFLKHLVTALAGTMIVGLITIVALLVIRLEQTPPTPTLPDTITLPAGVTPGAVTFGQDWVAVVADDTILIYDATTGALRQKVAITR